MNPQSRRIFIGAVTALVAGTVLFASLPAQSSIVSKPLIFIGKQAGKKLLKQAAKDVAKETAEKEARYLTRKFGSEAVRKAEAVSARKGIPKEQVISELRRFGPIYKRAGFSEEAIEFGLQHGQAGRFFVNRPELFTALKTSGCLASGNDAVIRESWRLVDGNGGSWKTLRDTLTAAEKSGSLKPGRDRDFCEPLLDNRAKAGALKDVTGKTIFPKGTELLSGHPNGNRQGIDRLLPEMNGPLRVIEFGSGKKPDAVVELSWDRIRENLAKYVETVPKEELLGKGFPTELLDPANLRNPNFPIHDFVTRTVIAPELNPGALRNLEKTTRGVIEAFQLP
jgi:hypothetical protein